MEVGAGRAAGVEAELQEQITANANAIELLTEGVDAEKVDGVKDLIDYVDKHGAEVTGMKEDIAANAKAIADHAALDHDFAAADTALENKLTAEIANKADKTVVEGIAADLDVAEGKIEVVEGKVEVLEGEMDAVEAAVATKAEQADLEAEIARATAAEGKALTDAKAYTDEEVAKDRARLDEIEEMLGEGEGSVADQIADAEQAAKDYADGLDEAMNERVLALEAIDHEHANKELLDTYTQTEADLADAVAKKHAHENAGVLAGISAEKVAAWDAAEANAKAHAETKVGELANGQVATNKANIEALQASLAEGGATANAIADAKKAGTDASAALEAYKTSNDAVVATKAAQADLTALAEAVATKAAQADLLTAVGRIEELEAVKHVEMTVADIDALFPVQA